MWLEERLGTLTFPHLNILLGLLPGLSLGVEVVVVVEKKEKEK